MKYYFEKFVTVKQQLKRRSTTEYTMKITSQNVGEATMLQLLDAALVNPQNLDLGEDPGPTEPIQGEEIPRGTLNSPAGRRLCLLSASLARLIVKEGDEHEASHLASTAHDCVEYNIRARLHLARQQVLNSLFWLALLDDIPEMVGNGETLIRKGWRVVSHGKPWSPHRLKLKGDSLGSNLLSRLADILLGSISFVDDGDLRSVVDGEEVVGIITDNRVKTINSLVRILQVEHLSLFPPNTNVETLIKLASTLSPAKRGELDLHGRYYVGITGVVYQLFEVCMADTITLKENLPFFGVRKEWKVVACANEVSAGKPVFDIIAVI